MQHSRIERDQQPLTRRDVDPHVDEAQLAAAEVVVEKDDDGDLAPGSGGPGVALGAIDVWHVKITGSVTENVEPLPVGERHIEVTADLMAAGVELHAELGDRVRLDVNQRHP